MAPSLSSWSAAPRSTVDYLRLPPLRLPKVLPHLRLSPPFGQSSALEVSAGQEAIRPVPLAASTLCLQSALRFSPSARGPSLARGPAAPLSGQAARPPFPFPAVRAARTSLAPGFLPAPCAHSGTHAAPSFSFPAPKSSPQRSGRDRVASHCYLPPSPVGGSSGCYNSRSRTGKGRLLARPPNTPLCVGLRRPGRFPGATGANGYLTPTASLRPCCHLEQRPLPVSFSGCTGCPDLPGL